MIWLFLIGLPTFEATIAVMLWRICSREGIKSAMRVGFWFLVLDGVGLILSSLGAVVGNPISQFFVRVFCGPLFFAERIDPNPGISDAGALIALGASGLSYGL